MAFLEAPDTAALPVLALLSLSSKPSRIAGFGEQCMPVLSFHTPNASTQELDPVAWGPARTAPPPLPPSREPEATARRHGQEKRPAAAGRKLDSAALNSREQAWLKEPLVHAHVPLPRDDALGAHLVHSVPRQYGGGVLVFCEKSIVYVPPPSVSRNDTSRAGASGLARGQAASTTNKRRRASDADGVDDAAAGGVPSPPKLVHVRVQRPMEVCAAATLEHDEENHARFVLSTSNGAVYLLVMHGVPSTDFARPWEPARMTLTRLGTSSPAARPQGLTYLGEGFVHINSTSTDAILHRLVDGELSEVHRWPSLGPIVDFVVDRGDATGTAVDAAHRRVITCSGAGMACSLRVFWNGVATTEEMQLDAPGCLGVYSVEQSVAEGRQTALLALLFTDHTQLVDVTADPMQDVSGAYAARGAPLNERALALFSLAGAAPRMLLATASSVALVRHDRPALHWRPDDGAEIVAVDANDEAVLVGVYGGVLYLLRVNEQGWAVQATGTLPSEISTVALPTEAYPYCLAGLWESTSVAALAYPSLARTDLGGEAALVCDALPTRVLPISFVNHEWVYLFVALGSGHVVIYQVLEHTLRMVRTVHLGPRPIQFLALPPGRFGSVTPQGSVLVLGRKSYVFFPDGDQLRYSALQYNDLCNAAPVVCAPHAPPVLVSPMRDAVVFYSLDNVREDDIRTVPLGGEQATAITQLDNAASLAITTWPSYAADHGQKDSVGSVRLLAREDLSTLTTYALLRTERPGCVQSMVVAGKTYLVVGTGFQAPEQQEVTAGRVLGFAVEGATLTLAFSLDVAGNVYGVLGVGSYLVAAVNAQVNTYALKRDNSLELLSRWGCAFIASSMVGGSTPDASTVVVGDAMRSLTVLHIDDNGRITENARDLDPYWTTAVAPYDEAKQQYIGTDIAMNLFVAERIPLEKQDGWSHTMRRRAAFHYGDMVNKFVVADNGLGDLAQAPLRMQLCTAGGALGLLRDVEDSTLLALLQQAMAEEVLVPGHIAWEEWRTLRTDHRTAPPANVLDGELLGRFLACTAAQRERIVAVTSHLAKRAHGHDAPEVSIDTILHALDGLAALG